MSNPRAAAHVGQPVLSDGAGLFDGQFAELADFRLTTLAQFVRYWSMTTLLPWAVFASVCANVSLMGSGSGAEASTPC